MNREYLIQILSTAIRMYPNFEIELTHEEVTKMIELRKLLTENKEQEEN